jgi:hypothetical protein
MIEIPRAIFKNDPLYHKVYEVIKKSHVVAKHTEEVLFKNRHTKNFCEVARHFVMLGDTDPIFIHYDVASRWKDPMDVGVMIESICFYADFLEYETARMKGFHSGRSSDIPNIN